MSNQYNNLLVATMGESLTEARNLELLPLVKNGDPAAREEMITGNMALVLGKVEAFINFIPAVAYLRDDLVSAGFVGLTRAVNAIAAGKEVSNAFNYILTAIDRELGELIDTERPIYVPGKSRRVAKANGAPLILPARVNVLTERFASAPSYERELEFRDLLASCCVCEEERTFLAMKEAGYTLAEIAKAINMPISSTHVMGRRLEARIDRRIESTR